MILLFAACGTPTDTDVYTERRFFNEIVAYGDPDDWVELYGSEDVDLSGWTMVDAMRDGEQPWTFPEGTTLSAGEYLVVNVDGGSEGGLHVPFRLDLYGGDLLLFDGDTLVDEGRFPLAFAGVSWARVPDGGPYWEQLLTPTEGATNGEVR
jgi:hypothetical protein